jgi:hypothetical protein
MRTHIVRNPAQHLALVAFSALFVVGVATAVGRWRGTQSRAEPRSTSTPTPLKLLHVSTFQLELPTTHHWRAERPSYTRGSVLVLACDPEQVEPRQTAEPVLYVGSQTAERVNAGTTYGNLVVVVPETEGSGGPFDPATTPIWFGSAELPERVDAARIAEERGETSTSRGAPGPAGDGRESGARVGLPMHLIDRVDLDRELANLVATYSPDEVDLVRQLEHY